MFLVNLQITFFDVWSFIAFMYQCMDLSDRQIEHTPKHSRIFRFKKFKLDDCGCGLKVGTDGVLLGAWALNDVPVSENVKILDVGTGSGLVALMLAQRFPMALISGIEIEPFASTAAKNNCQNSPFVDRLTIINEDFMQWVSDNKFDGIVCNPPYFTTGPLSENSRKNLARHSDSLTIKGFASKSFEILKKDGVVSLIYPFIESGDMIFEMTLAGFTLIRRCDVYHSPNGKPVRSLLEFCKHSDKFTHATLNIKNEDGDYSDLYKHLTGDFYLDF